MAYNREDYIRIKAEYVNKYAEAHRVAEERREALHVALPEVCEMDRALSRTGLEIMQIITSGPADTVQQRIEALKERNRGLLEARARLLEQNGYPADFSDVHYACERCGDTGFVDTKMCDCMRRALTLAGYESSGLGGLIRTQSFENFSLDYYPENREYMEMVVAGLKAFAEGFGEDTYRSYLFFGGTGLGKTHLSTAMAKVLIERGFEVLYVTSLRMMGDFEAKRFGNGESARDTNRYYDAQVLIIDDFGTEVVNSFTASCIYDVINTRINNRKSTVISTNLSKKDVEQKYGERVASRLFGEYQPLRFTGTDVRFQKIRRK